MIERTPPRFTQRHFLNIKCLSFFVIAQLVLQLAIIFFYIMYTAKYLVQYWEYGLGCGIVPPLVLWEMPYHGLYVLSYPNSETVRKRKACLNAWYGIGISVLIAALIPSIMSVKGSKLYFGSQLALALILCGNLLYYILIGAFLNVLMSSIRDECLVSTQFN